MESKNELSVKGTSHCLKLFYIGKYIISYRNQGYNEGYVDGKAAATTNANIKYTYHVHSANCYCAGNAVYESTDSSERGDGSGNIDIRNWFHCSGCGYRTAIGGYQDNSLLLNPGTGCLRRKYISYGNWGVTALSNATLKCGKTTSTIESATITFK